MRGTPHLTEKERTRVRTLHFDAQFGVSRIAQITGYGPSQIRTAIKSPTPKKRSGRPRKNKGPDGPDANNKQPAPQQEGEAAATLPTHAGETGDTGKGKAEAPAKPRSPAQPASWPAAQHQPSPDQQPATPQASPPAQFQQPPAQAQAQVQALGLMVPSTPSQPAPASQGPVLAPAQAQPQAQPQAAGQQPRGPAHYQFPGQPPASMQAPARPSYQQTTPNPQHAQPYAAPRTDQAAGAWDARQGYWPANQ